MWGGVRVLGGKNTAGKTGGATVFGNGIGFVRRFQSATWRELLTLRGHHNYVSSVAWSPDGSKLATASGDNTAQIYAIAPVQLLRLVRSRITRDLTAEECRLYLNAERCPPLPDVP